MIKFSEFEDTVGTCNKNKIILLFCKRENTQTHTQTNQVSLSVMLFHPTPNMWATGYINQIVFNNPKILWRKEICSCTSIFQKIFDANMRLKCRAFISEVTRLKFLWILAFFTIVLQQNHSKFESQSCIAMYLLSPQTNTSRICSQNLHSSSVFWYLLKNNIRLQILQKQ